MKKALGAFAFAAAMMAPAASVQAKEGKDGIHVGGAVRTQYNLNQWDDGSKDRGGDFDFELLRVNFDGEIGDMVLSGEHRFYTSNSGRGANARSGFDAPHHAWVGYNFDSWQLRVGMQQVPFGLLPFASHSWWFGIGYYIGLEDAYRVGVVGELTAEGPHSLHVGFIKSNALNSNNFGRYNFDVVTTPDGPTLDENDQVVDGAVQANEPVNTGVFRYAFTAEGEAYSSEFGVSGQVGQLYNSATTRRGSQWAAALHNNTNIGPLNIQLQAARYKFTPENPAGVDNDSVLGAFFEFANLIPAEADVYTANAAYTLPVELGPLNYLQFYNDFSVIDKDVSEWNTTWLNTTGVLIAAGPVFTYIDYIQGRNAAFIGPFSNGQNDNVRMTTGGGDTERRLNINIGYYF